MVNFLFAVEASISLRALAEVTTFGVVSTTPAVKTGPICAGVGAQLTVVAIKPWRTGALVAVFIVLYGKKTGQMFLLAINQIVSGLLSSKSILTVQLPPLRQGFPEHSFTWISQLAPVNPGRQEHV